MLNSESLNNVLDNKEISRHSILEIYHNAIKDPTELFSTAQVLREKHKGNSVTFSKKAFLNIVHDSGYPGIKLEKKIDFNKLYNEKFN